MIVVCTINSDQGYWKSHYIEFPSVLCGQRMADFITLFSISINGSVRNIDAVEFATHLKFF
jgi:hypothetical protein